MDASEVFARFDKLQVMPEQVKKTLDASCEYATRYAETTIPSSDVQIAHVFLARQWTGTHAMLADASQKGNDPLLRLLLVQLGNIGYTMKVCGYAGADDCLTVAFSFAAHYNELSNLVNAHADVLTEAAISERMRAGSTVQ